MTRLGLIIFAMILFIYMHETYIRAGGWIIGQ